MSRYLFYLTIFITAIFLCCSTKSNNNKTLDTNLSVDITQQNKQPAKDEIENWIVEKLKRFSKELIHVEENSTSKTTYKTVYNDFIFTHGALKIIKTETILGEVKSNNEESNEKFRPVSLIKNDIETTVYLNSFEKIDTFTDLIKDTYLTLHTKINGVTEITNTSSTFYNLGIRGEDKIEKQEPSKYNFPHANISFDVTSEEDIVNRLDKAFKTLQKFYPEKETF